MNASIPAEQSKQIAWLIKNVQTLLKRPSGGGGGFDPNADPVVIGSGANGNGFSGSIVGGLNAYGNAYDVVVWGDGADAESDGAVAIGADSYVPAGCDSAVAVGYRASALAAKGVAVGNRASARGAHSVAIGYNSYCATAADTGICIGDGTVNSDSGVCIGANLVTGFAGVAIGHGAQSTRDYQITLGGALAFVEIPGTGTVYHSPDGSRWLMSVDNSGSIAVVTAP